MKNFIHKFIYIFTFLCFGGSFLTVIGLGTFVLWDPFHLTGIESLIYLLPTGILAILGLIIGGYVGRKIQIKMQGRNYGKQVLVLSFIAFLAIDCFLFFMGQKNPDSPTATGTIPSIIIGQIVIMGVVSGLAFFIDLLIKRKSSSLN